MASHLAQPTSFGRLRHHVRYWKDECALPQKVPTATFTHRMRRGAVGGCRATAVTSPRKACAIAISLRRAIGLEASHAQSLCCMEQRGRNPDVRSSGRNQLSPHRLRWMAHPELLNFASPRHTRVHGKGRDSGLGVSLYRSPRKRVLDGVLAVR